MALLCWGCNFQLKETLLSVQSSSARQPSANEDTREGDGRKNLRWLRPVSLWTGLFLAFQRQLPGTNLTFKEMLKPNGRNMTSGFLPYRLWLGEASAPKFTLETLYRMNIVWATAFLCPFLLHLKKQGGSPAALLEPSEKMWPGFLLLVHLFQLAQSDPETQLHHVPPVWAISTLQALSHWTKWTC